MSPPFGTVVDITSGASWSKTGYWRRKRRPWQVVRMPSARSRLNPCFDAVKQHMELAETPVVTLRRLEDNP